MTTDADRQSAVEAAARGCYLATLAILDVIVALLFIVGPHPLLGVVLIVIGIDLALVHWVQ